MGIRAIGPKLTQKIISPFKAKSTSSNPFEHNTFSGKVFKGSALPFADLFEKKAVIKEQSKLKMMSGSVIAAVSNFGHKVSQPIVNFTRNVKLKVNNAVSAIKALPQRVSEIGRDMSQKMSEKLRLDKLRKEEAKDGIKILSMREINTKASIENLKNTWLEENKLELSKRVAKEAA